MPQLAKAKSGSSQPKLITRSCLAIAETGSDCSRYVEISDSGTVVRLTLIVTTVP